MTLLEYLLQSHAVEREVKLANQAREMAAQILKENAESGGSRYPTVDSMWRELLRRAEAHVQKLVEIKIASILVHIQELLSPDGREADRQALIPLVNDPDVVAWLDGFDKALLPVKRIRGSQTQT